MTYHTYRAGVVTETHVYGYVSIRIYICEYLYMSYLRFISTVHLLNQRGSESQPSNIYFKPKNLI